MNTQVYDAFRTAWSYGPTTSPDNPDKSLIHSAGRVVDDQIAAVQASIDGVASFAASGAKWAAPVALATTGNITLSGEQTVDGGVTSTSRVLVWKQNTPSQNGLYTTSPGAWNRATDADTAAEMLGLAVSVNGGTVNGGKSFICQAIAPITIGTTALPFVEMLNQSAFTASVNALSSDIDAVDARYDGMLAPVSQQQVIGVASPVAGTGGSATAYALAKEADFAGTVRTVSLYAGVSSTVQVAVFSRSSSDVWTRVHYVDVATTGGQVNEFVVNLPIDKGQYVGIVTTVNGAIHYVANTHRGFFNGTLTGGAFTDTTPSTANELQLKFTIDQLEQPQASVLFTDTKTLARVIGTASPAAGSGTSAGTIVIAPDLPADAIVDYVEWYSNATAAVVIGVYERVGLDLTRVETLGRVTTYPGGLTRFSVNRVLGKGQLIGLQSATAGFMVSNPGTSSGYYYGATTTGDTFTAPGRATTFIMQIAIVLRGEAAPSHTVSFANVDKLLMVGPSYQNGHYNIIGKSAWSKVSLFSDFNFENYSYSGHNMQELLDRLRLDAVTGYAPIHPKNMGLTYVFIMEGYNSFNEGVSFTDYQEDIRLMVETVKSFGAIPVLCSEWKPVYDASAHAVYKALAQELGVLYVDMIPHTLRMFDGTVNGAFTQGSTTVQHPGTRTNALIADRLDRFVKTLARPANAMKLFRKRGSVTVTDIDDDLMFRDDYERAERFNEILINQVSLSPATAKYFDELTASAGSYDQNYISKSEYLLLQDGGTIPLGDYALLEVVVNATQLGVDRFELKLSDPGVTVYVKDALQAPYGADGKSACLWTEITGSAGVFALDHTDLPGKMQFDKLTFLLHKSGGVTIDEPKVRWWGEAGKPGYPLAVSPSATGAELLNVTKFATISGNKATGWDDIGGTITPSNDATYQLPYDITHFINVDGTKKVVQTLSYAVDNFDDIEVEIRVTARFFPAVFASSGTYPGGSAINEDTFDWRKVVVDLIDPTGTYTFTQSGKIGLWWDEVVFRAILPMRVNPLDIRVSGSGEIQLAKVSVKSV